MFKFARVVGPALLLSGLPVFLFSRQRTYPRGFYYFHDGGRLVPVAALDKHTAVALDPGVESVRLTDNEGQSVEAAYLGSVNQMHFFKTTGTLEEGGPCKCRLLDEVKVLASGDSAFKVSSEHVGSIEGRRLVTREEGVAVKDGAVIGLVRQGRLLCSQQILGQFQKQERRDVQHPAGRQRLGISVMSSSEGGAMVVSVKSNSPLVQLLRLGDVIQRVDGVDVLNAEEFMERVRDKRKARLFVRHGPRTREVDVSL